MIMNRGLKAPG
jgi:hypothetical protein